jgi:hypothetical protein
MKAVLHFLAYIFFIIVILLTLVAVQIIDIFSLPIKKCTKKNSRHKPTIQMD